MIPGTTPQIRLRVNDNSLDLSLAETVYVTISQGATILTKQGNALTIDGNIVYVWLNQQDTLRLRIGKAEVQINWTYPQYIDSTKKRNATRVAEIVITKQLLTRVLD